MTKQLDGALAPCGSSAFPEDRFQQRSALRESTGPSNLAVLYRNHHGGLVRKAYALLGEIDAAEDCVHAVFVRLLSRACSGVTASYLIVAVRNQCLTELARRHREQIRNRRLIDTARADLARSEDPDPGLGSRGSENVNLLLASLPTRCHSVLKLRMAGFTYDQIGTHLGISPKTVDAQIQRAKTLLNRKLKDGSGLTNEPGAKA
jgi:RNA polymerase sigma-70 factor, ECF subfamily